MSEQWPEDKCQTCNKKDGLTAEDVTAWDGMPAGICILDMNI